MDCIELRYDGETCRTQIKINGLEKYIRGTPFDYIHSRKIEDWISPTPNTSWKGFFATLNKYLGEDILRIEFYGAVSDFKVLKNEYFKYGKRFLTAALVHMDKNDNDSKRLDKDDFKIVVAAPMSAGKSTLINALLGHDLLPAHNRATTAAITEIKVNNTLNDYIVTAYKNDGTLAAESVHAHHELMEKLNADSRIHQIEVEGPVQCFKETAKQVSIIDLPGANNIMDSRHRDLMEIALNYEDVDVFLFIFDCTQPTTSDCDELLKSVIEIQKNKYKSKLVFVANKADRILENDNETLDSFFLQSLSPILSRYGINNPDLFFTSAAAVKLAREKLNASEVFYFSDDEQEKLNHYIDIFADNTLVRGRSCAKEQCLDTVRKDYFSELLGNSNAMTTEDLNNVILNSGILELEKLLVRYCSHKESSKMSDDNQKMPISGKKREVARSKVKNPEIVQKDTLQELFEHDDDGFLIT